MDILTTLYMATGFIFAVGFIPQIITLIRDQSGAVSINITTYFTFTLCSIISFLYAWLNNGDVYFMLGTGLCTIGNSVVTGLAIAKRLQFSQQTTHPLSAMVSLS